MTTGTSLECPDCHATTVDIEYLDTTEGQRVYVSCSTCSWGMAPLVHAAPDLVRVIETTPIPYALTTPAPAVH